MILKVLKNKQTRFKVKFFVANRLASQLKAKKNEKLKDN